MEYPKLNHIDIFSVEHEGKNLICLRNPRNNEKSPLLVSEMTLYILQYFDGRHSVRNIIDSFKKDFNITLEEKKLNDLIKQLDSALLLESENYEKYQKEIEKQFFKSGTIFPSHAGICYPPGRNDLREMINGYFDKEGSDHNSEISKTVKGIISPHIDYRRGWKTYVKAYRYLQNTEANRFIILGTSHYADTENPYILTKKSFNTPFGTIYTDTEIVESIANHCGWDIYDNETAYRSEHSIEFQIIFLQYLLGERDDYKIVPILCNSFDKHVNKGISPSEDRKISVFIETIRRLVRDSQKKFCFIAGVDLAHFGRKFGDMEKMDNELLNWIEERDRNTLDKVSALDPEGFYKSIEEEKDRRKICGLSSIYTLLHTIDASEGNILDYDKAMEKDSDSVVTFASAVLNG